VVEAVGPATFGFLIAAHRNVSDSAAGYQRMRPLLLLGRRMPDKERAGPERRGADEPSRVCSRSEASGFLVGPAVFKTVVGARAPRRVRFPSASALI
jgi:hypothetical protein